MDGHTLVVYRTFGSSCKVWNSNDTHDVLITDWLPLDILRVMYQIPTLLKAMVNARDTSTTLLLLA